MLVDAKDAATLQALLELVGLSMKRQLDRCKIGMAGLLRVKGYLPGTDSLRKADAEFVGCCMAGNVRDPTVEIRWEEFLRSVAAAARRRQGDEGYEGELKAMMFWGLQLELGPWEGFGEREVVRRSTQGSCCSSVELLKLEAVIPGIYIPSLLHDTSAFVFWVVTVSADWLI